MIGHFLNILTPEEEDRVLTTPLLGMMAADRSAAFPAGCLLQVVDDVTWGSERPHGHFHLASVHMNAAMELFHVRAFDLTVNWLRFLGRHHVGHRYDQLCTRFGTGRISRVIRERIVANQIRRAVSPVGVSEMRA